MTTRSASRRATSRCVGTPRVPNDVRVYAVCILRGGVSRHTHTPPCKRRHMCRVCVIQYRAIAQGDRRGVHITRPQAVGILIPTVTHMEGGCAHALPFPVRLAGSVREGVWCLGRGGRGEVDAEACRYHGRDRPLQLQHGGEHASCASPLILAVCP